MQEFQGVCEGGKMIDPPLDSRIKSLIDYAMSVGMSMGELLEYSEAEIRARYKR